MKAPAFKPLCEVIRIKKREDADAAAGSELYKAFLNAGKKNEEELRSKSVKIVIYEHVKYEEEKQLSSSSSRSDSDGAANLGHGCALPQGESKMDKKGKKKKETPGGEHGEAAKVESTNVYQAGNGGEGGAKEKGNPKEGARETAKVTAKVKAKAQGKEKAYREGEPTAGGEEDTHKVGEKGPRVENNKEGVTTQGEGTPNGKNTPLTIHTQKSDVVKERKSSKVLGTVKILYNFYVNLFDKLKEEVENIQSGAANNHVDLFRDVSLYSNCVSLFDVINLCEDLKIIKTFLNSKKECELIWILTVNYLDKVDVKLFERYKHKIDVPASEPVRERVNEPVNEPASEPAEGPAKRNRSEERTEVSEKKGGEKTQKGDIAPVPIKGVEANAGADTSERMGDPPHPGQEMLTLKEYIYANCHERKDAIMFRRVNFFVFLYVLIYIIKTSSRKIKSLSDDVKKVRSFFFFLNLYKKKKTIETLRNIYKDKYLPFFQNFKSAKEIEEYRRRKIFCHKFSFHNVDKILNQRGDELVRLKEACTRGGENQPGDEKPPAEEKQIGEGSYELTNYVNAAELDSNLNSTGNPNSEGKRESPPLLSPYLLDYIFKNYCYKKKHWKMKENAWINFGVVRKEENRRYKMDIYNHTKFNITVDVLIDGDLPILAIFKDKLFCVSSKYSIYLQIDPSKEGEWFGFVSIAFRYKNATKGGDAVRVPVYVRVCP
ncbi:conserved Plasmodium protein, unknown function [Plasmodium vivax]|uniref:Uncharacterized protein n=3 Tax=Plasmodium vivax TaxID=5855 RepID=A5K627_PLAVS|nr:hypothetical protein, conserved [Plasmodium vivax]KMZ88240.1 hypothetical protein PVBG_02701 [Plasmodium vivax Brazil I]EDL45362.1 hypothetical protein, conserved [Plasmodium vivax]CAI7718957.1 conserved Plasmodium protein, unknown function [Plasmodium vivax]SCO66000.1 conserved Plasmodium protein, unknown function [Plasmodium vivax]VUZ94165.1 conserved Plasmodium protein, unknown function [Plasmodium vivax]|eukprot:XP_001615089.1 hypothetical protein [Plasmodium vivax Sal-1]